MHQWILRPGRKCRKWRFPVGEQRDQASDVCYYLVHLTTKICTVVCFKRICTTAAAARSETDGALPTQPPAAGGVVGKDVALSSEFWKHLEEIVLTLPCPHGYQHLRGFSISCMLSLKLINMEKCHGAIETRNINFGSSSFSYVLSHNRTLIHPAFVHPIFM